MIRITRSRLLRQLVIGLGTSLMLAACSSEADYPTASSGKAPAVADDTLKVAIEPAFPPFEFEGEGGELEGFDIDLMNAIGEQAGLTIEYESLPFFDMIIPSLQTGAVDAAISAITIKQERLETVDFSRPYFKAGLAIAVSEDSNITSLSDLEGKKIAVQVSAAGADKAAEIAGAEIITFDSVTLALQALSIGNADAVINHVPATLAAIATGNIPRVKVVGKLLTEEFYGIALPKDSDNLSVINDSLAALIADGSYAKIYQKWFGAEPPELPESAF